MNTGLRPRSLATSFLLVLACAGPAEPSSGAITERRISPVVANAAITQWTADHLIWFDPALLPTRLLVLLPGTNGVPANFGTIGRLGAEQGYRVVGLMYPDTRAVVQECATDPATTCMESMREEIVRGIDVSAHVTVDAANSITGRLGDLLAHLHRVFPAEGWNTFLADGSPRWETIAVGGLSQGGGHAVYIAKLHAVARVLMFGAPADGFSGQVAPWMQLGATPADRYFGFRHQRDPFISIKPNWLALGLGAFGPEKLIDESTASFDGTHMLVTDVLPRTGSYADAHASVVADGPTPRTAGGEPVYAAVWRHLLGRPE